MAFWMLPVELVSAIFAHVALVDLLVLRAVSRALRRLSSMDNRWLPLITPPSMCTMTLSLIEHGEAMIRLYATYQRWLRNWRTLVATNDIAAIRLQTTVLDSFFALAPWENRGVVNSAWTPLHWLQNTIYTNARVCCHQQCVTVQDNCPRVASPALDELPSYFYQQAVYTLPNVRLYSVPVEASTLLNAERRRSNRYVVQPLNIRHLSHQSDVMLPDLTNDAITSIDIACKLMSCYLPSAQIECRPLSSFHVDYERFTCRDARRTYTISGAPVYQLFTSAFGSSRRRKVDDAEFTTYVVGPHLRPVGKNGRYLKNISFCLSASTDVANERAPWYVCPLCIVFSICIG